MNTTTEPVDSEESEATLPQSSDKSEKSDEATEQALVEADPEKKVSRFRQIYRKYRAKGKWFVVGFFVFYLIRDTLLYIILPWYLAKGGMSIFDWLFDD